MAYTDQEMSGNRIVAIVIVVLIHLALGYALVSGLAYSAVKKAVERVTTVDVEEPEEVPEEEEPPPPEEVPDTAPPPPVAPPPPINVSTTPPPINTTTTIPPPSPPARVIPPPAPPAPPAPPPAPPPPRFAPKDPTPRNNQGSWVTTNDYPRRALREGAEGVTRVRLSVGANGRVASCSVSGSSGNSELDAATCKNIQRRARFRPATNGEGNEVAGNFTMSVRWQMPD
ncbi:energy transducer TonB [Altererythrobacter sp. ZODW24]|uniref:energy transducer TonB n=1 Tax=Altererythrobacter sp. ZODW24 TaxID=2185142 RepID=UPI000DF75EB8|nr:energy transducer TonB [Altererythrobacter sp. ZODW24]